MLLCGSLTLLLCIALSQMARGMVDKGLGQLCHSRAASHYFIFKLHDSVKIIGSYFDKLSFTAALSSMVQ